MKLAESVGLKRFARCLLLTFVVFIPIFILLLPGYYVGNLVTEQANKGIEAVQEFTDPEIIKETVKEHTPWYIRPLVWTGVWRGYGSIIANETKQISRPKPWHIQSLGAVLKTLLLAISIYSFAWVTLLLLRAFSSLFGRILVASEPPVSFDMRPGRYSRASKIPDGFISSLAVSSILELPLKTKETLLVRRPHIPANTVPATALKFRGGRLWARIRENLVLLSKVRMESEKRPPQFHSHGSGRYIAATLAAGQNVSVSLAHLIAFSGTVRFRSHYDFNLAMLSMGRAVTTVASGPGHLILSVQGYPGLHEKAEDAPLIDMQKLILFGMDAEFEIRAAKGLLDYYTSGCVVQPLKGNLFVSSPAIPKSGNIGQNLWNLVKQVYMPI